MFNPLRRSEFFADHSYDSLDCGHRLENCLHLDLAWYQRANFGDGFVPEKPLRVFIATDMMVRTEDGWKTVADEWKKLELLQFDYRQTINGVKREFRVAARSWDEAEVVWNHYRTMMMNCGLIGSWTNY